MYQLTISQQPLRVELTFAEAHAWRETLRWQFPEEVIEISEGGQALTACIFCELPTPATVALGNWEVCEAHAAALTMPEPLCGECGQPLAAEDVEAGETVCLECAPEVGILTRRPFKEVYCAL